MIPKESQDDIYLIELGSDCSRPRGARILFDHAEIKFPEPNYVSWQVTYHHDDSDEITFGFGKGTLSPFQNTILLLRRASDLSGGHIQFLSEYHFCPVLIGQNGGIVPLYQFIEVIDGLLDYQGIQAEIPNLSYAQIHGSFAFLRKVAQFNTSNKDIDDLEDEELVNNPQSLEELRRAFADREINRVLNLDERDNG